MTHIFPRAFIFTGPPCSGKSSTLEYICQQRNWPCVEETGRQLLIEAEINGTSNPRTSEGDFSHKVFDRQLIKESQLDPTQPYLMDRGLIDSIAYTKVTGGNIIGIDKLRLHKRYRAVFLFDALPFEAGDIRLEVDRVHQNALHTALEAVYRQYDHEILPVPVMPIAERASFIVQHIEAMLNDTLAPKRPKGLDGAGDISGAPPNP